MADQDRLNQLYRQAEAKRLAIAKILFSPNAWVYPDKHAARLSAAVSEFVGIIGQHEEALKVGAGGTATTHNVELRGRPLADGPA